MSAPLDRRLTALERVSAPPRVVMRVYGTEAEAKAKAGTVPLPPDSTMIGIITGVDRPPDREAGVA